MKTSFGGDMQALFLAIILGGSTLLGACASTEQAPPYWFPRHPNLSAMPAALAQGTLEIRDNCLYLGGSLLIWPEDYSLTTVNGVGVVSGDGVQVAPGQQVEIGGGSYERADQLPSGRQSALSVPCDGPYMWVSGIVSVRDPQDAR